MESPGPTRRTALFLIVAALTLPAASDGSDQAAVSQPSAATTAVNTPAAATAPPAESLFSKSLGDLEKIFQILAYVVGAFWVYFNYFKGRTYRPRLEPKVSGELGRTNGYRFVKCVVQVKNVGLSKVTVLQKGTALRVLAFDPTAQGGWRLIRILSALERHEWIEPGETVEEHSLAPVDPVTPAVRIELIITSTKEMWEAAAVVLAERSESDG